jgi:hypothetical protein
MVFLFSCGILYDVLSQIMRRPMIGWLIHDELTNDLERSFRGIPKYA